MTENIGTSTMTFTIELKLSGDCHPAKQTHVREVMESIDHALDLRAGDLGLLHFSDDRQVEDWTIRHNEHEYSHLNGYVRHAVAEPPTEPSGWQLFIYLHDRGWRCREQIFDGKGRRMAKGSDSLMIPFSGCGFSLPWVDAAIALGMGVTDLQKEVWQIPIPDLPTVIASPDGYQMVWIPSQNEYTNFDWSQTFRELRYNQAQSQETEYTEVVSWT